MQPRLDMGFHKVILTITLLVFLVIAIALGGYLMDSEPAVPVLGIMTFSVSFVLFALCVLTISIVIRTRDELHAMHEENKKQFHGILHAVESLAAGARKKRR